MTSTRVTLSRFSDSHFRTKILHHPLIHSHDVNLLLFTMDGVSLYPEPTGNDDAEELELRGDCAMGKYVDQMEGDNPLPPAVGMEFHSYEDVYYFYNSYAKEQGFGVRVSNTWYRKGKERYRGKFSCSSAGFKKKSEANRPRPETRTGCPAMIKLRLMETKRWRVIEVELEHNHLISPTSGKFYKSHKTSGVGAKRALQTDIGEEGQKVRLFQTVVFEADDNGSLDVGNSVANSILFKLKEGDAQTVQKFFARLQLMDVNFFYVADLNEEGYLRNLFWINARSRAAYGYFGDVVKIETSCLTDKYEVPLVSFIGLNHHSQPVLLGCGLLAGETVESYTWAFRAWLTCVLGRSPQVVITDQSDPLKTAIADVFPRAAHCFCLSHTRSHVLEKLRGLLEFEAIKSALNEAVCCSQNPDQFEAAWEDMIQIYGVKDHKFLQVLYDDRRRWVPVYLKETPLAGIFPLHSTDGCSSFFDNYLEKHTSLKEFLDVYDHVLESQYQLEAMADMDSRNSSLMLQSRSYFELQLSKLYTNNMLEKYEKEIKGMYSCFSTRLSNSDGAIVTYMVKENMETDENRMETRNYEVLYNPSKMEVLCICGLFNSRGYLCRHALSVLGQNGVEEIPSQYILSRWRKDVKRSYVLDRNSNGIDVKNPIHRYDHLFKYILQVVEDGQKSQNHYKIGLKSLEDMLGKLNLVDDRNSV